MKDSSADSPAKEAKKLSTSTERALKAKAEVEALIKEAIHEQLQVIKEAEKRLAELGYTKPNGGGVSGGRQTRNTDPARKHCSVCELKGHDGRAHRGQGKNKKKFTPAELKELGLA